MTIVNTTGLTLRAEATPADQVTFAATAAGKSGDVITSDPVTARPVVVAGAGDSHAIGDTITAYAAGRFEGPILGTDVVGAGVNLYWDAGNNRMTVTSAGNTLLGRAYGAKAAGPTVQQVLLGVAGT